MQNYLTETWSNVASLCSSKTPGITVALAVVLSKTENQTEMRHLFCLVFFVQHWRLCQVKGKPAWIAKAISFEH